MGASRAVLAHLADLRLERGDIPRASSMPDARGMLLATRKVNAIGIFSVMGEHAAAGLAVSRDVCKACAQLVVSLRSVTCVDDAADPQPQ